MSSAVVGAPPQPTLSTGDGPYKGLRSYETEDGHLFHGRQEATEQILAKILSSRTMVLHAPSAAGKTSLINARVLSGLEARGWMAVRVRPRDNPMASVQFDMLRQLLGSPRAEAGAIMRAHVALAYPNENLLVGDLLDRYDALPLRDERRRSLAAPMRMPHFQNERAGEEVNTHPMFCRLLRGSIDVARFDEHVAILCGEPLRTAVEVSAAAFAEELACERSALAHRAILDALPGPAANLRTFFEAWWRLVAHDQPEYGVVLCIDQFEELFTRFADPGPGRRGTRILDWRLRERFFKELDTLFTPAERADAVHEESVAPAAASLRLVISLRDEFIAQLDRVQPAAERADATTFHLPQLALSEAAEAIRDPALEYGYRYEDSCFKDIILKLAQEQRFIEPAHLQIVCDRLWRACTQAPPPDAPHEVHRLSAERPADTIDYATYEHLGKAEGILRNFFVEFLESFKVHDQLELLEMLELLITPGGTRNIADWSLLVQRRLRDPRRRGELLVLLQAATVVRAEWRHGTRFVELTHEFLIEPIRAAIKKQLYGMSDSARLLAARRALEQASASNFRTDERVLLSSVEVDALLASRTTGDLTNPEMSLPGGVSVGWDLPSAEVLLRSAVIASDDADMTWPGRLRQCTLLYSNQVTVSANRSVIADDVEPALERNTGEMWVPDGPPLRVGAIVSSYLASPSAKVRLNTIRALGHLAGPDCVQALAEVALRGSPDEKTAAEVALEHLDDDTKRAAVDLFAKDLTSPTIATRAYLLLGRLGGTGAQSAFSEMRFRDRWRLASTRVTGKRPRNMPWHRLPILQAGMPGSALGLLFASALVSAAFRDDWSVALGRFLPLLSIGLLVGAPAVILAATRLSEPIRLHPDRVAATYVEVWRAAVSAFVSLTATLLCVATLVDSESVLLTTAVVAVFGLSAACVRAGTLIAGDAHRSEVTGSRLAQTLLGGSAGACVAGFAVVLLRRWDALPMEQSADLVLGWLFFVPASFGLALAYAGLEPPTRTGAGYRAMHRRHARTINWVVTALVLVVLAIVAVRGPRYASEPFALQHARVDEREIVRTEPSAEFPTDGQARSVSTLPARYWVRVRPQRTPGGGVRSDSVTLEAKLTGGEGEYQLVLRDSTTGRKIIENFESSSLTPGAYVLEVGSHVDLTLDDYANELAARLRRSGGTMSRSHGNQRTHNLRLRLTSTATTQLVERDSMEQLIYSARMLADSAIALGLDSNRLADPPTTSGASRALSQAIEKLQPAWRSDSTVVGWLTLNQVCWAGAVVGEARRVLPYCEAAVQAERNTFDVDSRGLARALTGDALGAIEDFRWYVAQSERSEASPSALRDNAAMTKIALRKSWISALQAGRPLDLATVRRELSPLE